MPQQYFKIMVMTVIGSFFAVISAYAEISVFVSILPQKYFVQQIGKDLVDVQVMVAPGASPATYEPNPRQMMALSEAELYFAVGVPFERTWLEKIAATNPGMRIVHTDNGIEKIPMAAHHHEDNHGENHSEGGEADEHHEKAPATGGHGHEASLDPHVWLSPPLVKIQARHIYEGLAAADPEHEAAYAANYNAFLAELDALHKDLLAEFKGHQGEAFMVFHPSWGYFAQAYGLRQIAIEMEGKDPKPAQLKDLITAAETKGVKVLFVQPQFSTKSARVIADAIKGQVIFADPLAEDWANNLREQASKFQQALK